MQKRIDEFDEEFGRVEKKSQLFGTPTESSLINLLKDFKNYDVFIDLGSGTGNVLFFMQNFNPNAKYRGIEYDKDLYEESQRRQKILKTDIHIVLDDIMELTVQDLDNLYAKHILLFSFDAVMPKDVINHIKSELFDKYEKRITWITTKKVDGTIKLKKKLYIGKIGANENDLNVETILNNPESDEEEEEEEENLSIVDLKDYLTSEELNRWGKTNNLRKTRLPYWKIKAIVTDIRGLIEMNSFNMYKLEKLCVICKEKAYYKCEESIRFYCSKECQIKDYRFI